MASPPTGVRIEVTTSADADAARVLSDALSNSSDSWSVKSADTSRSSAAWTALFSSAEGHLRLHVPHTLEMSSTADAPMAGRPKLQAGSLTFETRSGLSSGMAHALAAAAASATSSACGAEPRGREGSGGPLAALDRILAQHAPEPPPPPQPQHSLLRQLNPPPPSPLFNEDAARASVKNAAAWGTPSLPREERGGRGGGGPMRTGGGSGRASREASMRAACTPSEAIEMITELGARVFAPAASAGEAAEAGTSSSSSNTTTTTGGWEALAGGEDVRRAVEEALLLPLRHPEAFESVMRATRAGYAQQRQLVRPTALLFHGPPGTGKTHAARIAAESADLPLVSAPLEGLISKWYGEGEQKLAMLFLQCEALGPCVLFLDEIDSLGGSRNRDGMHEASRRMLSVLLRHLDGFDACKHVALIGATNRPNDLDAALVSRFDVRVPFPAPDVSTRALVFGRYARHLSEDERIELARESDGLSGRDILDACKAAERRWIYDELSSAAGRGDGVAWRPPPMSAYVESVAARGAGIEAEKEEAEE